MTGSEGARLTLTALFAVLGAWYLAAAAISVRSTGTGRGGQALGLVAGDVHPGGVARRQRRTQARIENRAHAGSVAQEAVGLPGQVGRAQQRQVVSNQRHQSSQRSDQVVRLVIVNALHGAGLMVAAIQCHQRHIGQDIFKAGTCVIEKSR